MPYNFHRGTDPPLHDRLYPPTVSSKVFFNPAFPRQPQHTVMHANSAAKTNIHFNPNRLIQTTTNPQELYQIPSGVHPMTYSHQRIPRNVPSMVHVNPAVLNQPRIPVNNPYYNFPMPQNEILSNWYYNPAVLNQQTMPNSGPIHINPKFVAKPLVSDTCRESQVLQDNSDISRIASVQNTIANNEPSCSTANTTNFTSSSPHSELTVTSATEIPVISSTSVSIKESAPNSNVNKKSPNSSLVSLSKRKLIRVKRSTRPTASITNTLNSSTPLKKRLSSSGFKRTKISPKSKNNLMKVNNMKLVRTADIHWYNKVDKTVPRSTYEKNVMINNIG